MKKFIKTKYFLYFFYFHLVSLFLFLLQKRTKCPAYVFRDCFYVVRSNQFDSIEDITEINFVLELLCCLLHCFLFKFLYSRLACHESKVG